MLCLFVLTALVVLAAAIPPRVPMLDGRIVGGEETSIQDHKYQASLEYYDSHFCGCSIIADRWALTAAHCTDGALTAALSVRVGSSTIGSGGLVLLVTSIHQHSSFDPITLDYDISLIKLAAPANHPLTQPINLVDEEVLPDVPVVVTGWGTTSEGGSLSSTLQRVVVHTITRQQCQSSYGSLITNRMICAGGWGGKDSCQGDSGGPMAVYGGNSVQPGIVSWGRGCARPGYPGVYTNVAYFHDWITEIISKESIQLI
ncbi:hypothetical protein ILUMI_26487 [Ignelater luminosus]|uniref:Peptidase S1 domain-containing protein n=1 Tax=Ignelater luminosus TaxID=2038154 RepID=A0A8K0C6M4_IGNLU|nr:hypothetical protein ILUMI_26487 [Ignelater luminosus]